MASVLNSFFNKIYCINLERRSDRWSFCIEEFKKHDLTVEQFNAIDGNKMPYKGKLLPGQFGCLQSHYHVLKQAKQLNLGNILILEDDNCFINNLNIYFSENISKIPNDWDMLYLGVRHKQIPLIVNDVIVRNTKVYTTSCYSVSNKIYDVILTEIEKEEKAIDIIYSELCDKINSYSFYPPIAFQKSGFSDITGKNEDYSKLMNQTFS